MSAGYGAKTPERLAYVLRRIEVQQALVNQTKPTSPLLRERQKLLADWHREAAELRRILGPAAQGNRAPPGASVNGKVQGFLAKHPKASGLGAVAALVAAIFLVGWLLWRKAE